MTEDHESTPTDSPRDHDPSPGPGPSVEHAEAQSFALEAARLVADDKCEDVLVLDVTRLSQVTDYLVIASGTSQRQMRGVASNVQELAREHGFSAFRSSLDDQSQWVLLDYVDVVVHLFEPGTRAHYDLEMLWGDAPRVEWSHDRATRPGGRDHAGLHGRKPS